MAKSLLIKQIKSTAQLAASQKLILKSIGLRGVSSSIYRTDTRAIRGMLNKVQHLIVVEQVEKSTLSRPKRAEKSMNGCRVG
jgi:ribosomal protein L30